jgi:uncharacterized membrane protein YraQ (UPF0718 family)
MYCIVAVLFVLSFIKDRKKTRQALMKGLKAVEGILPQFLSIIIVIAVSLALLQPETISRFIGETSGFIGMAAASIIGAVTLVPGFVAFPVAGELLKNGAGVLQIAAFVSSLMMVGIITLPMEIKYFGKKAALIRNAAAFLFSLAAAFFVAWAVQL